MNRCGYVPVTLYLQKETVNWMARWLYVVCQLDRNYQIVRICVRNKIYILLTYLKYFLCLPWRHLSHQLLLRGFQIKKENQSSTDNSVSNKVVAIKLVSELEIWNFKNIYFFIESVIAVVISVLVVATLVFQGEKNFCKAVIVGFFNWK